MMMRKMTAAGHHRRARGWERQFRDPDRHAYSWRDRDYVDKRMRHHRHLVAKTGALPGMSMYGYEIGKIIVGDVDSSKG